MATMNPPEASIHELWVKDGDLARDARRRMPNPEGESPLRGWPVDARGMGRRVTLKDDPRQQQNCTDRHKENAGPVRFEPQESHAAPSRLQSAANRPAGIRAAKRSPPNNSAHHVQTPPKTSSAPSPIRNIFASQFIAAPLRRDLSGQAINLRAKRSSFRDPRPAGSR